MRVFQLICNKIIVSSFIHGRVKLSAALFLCVALCVAILCSGCVTRGQRFATVDGLINEASYRDAVSLIEEQRDTNTLYNRMLDRVLYHTDVAMIHYFDRQHAKSNEHFDEAEQLIEDYYTKSITQAVASALINDNAIEYPGEDFEDLYINLFKALNYIALDDYEAAFVEVRRMNEKIQYLETKYQVIKESIDASEQGQSAKEISADIADSADPPPFTASALAHFLSMLLYTRDGQQDNALIDYNAMRQLFDSTKSVYTNPFPNILAPSKRNIPSGTSRLVVIAFSGLVPMKIERSYTILTGGFNARIAIPVLSARESAVARVALFDAEGAVIEDLQLLEPIDRIAVSTFERRKELIYAKAVIRAVVKGVVAGVSNAALQEANIPLLGTLIQIGVLVSERADLRSARYLPGGAYVYDGIVTIKQGMGAEVRFLGRNGETLCHHPLSDALAHTTLAVESMACTK